MSGEHSTLLDGCAGAVARHRRCTLWKSGGSANNPAELWPSSSPPRCSRSSRCLQALLQRPGDLSLVLATCRAPTLVMLARCSSLRRAAEPAIHQAEQAAAAALTAVRGC